jgi:hypothetical protein
MVSVDRRFVWSKEDIKRLLKLVEKHGRRDWDMLRAAFPGRTKMAI